MTLEKLTAREMEIITIVAEEGAGNKVIAFRTGLTEITVKFHIRNAMKKMGAINRVQCVIIYWKAKLEEASR